LLVGLLGVLVALVLPFVPVIADQTTVSWPAPGRSVVSSTAFFAPYRPAELTATVPCSAIRAATDRGGAVTVLATGPDGDGLVLRTETGVGQLLLGRRVVSTQPVAGVVSDCRTRVHADPTGTVITIGSTKTIKLADEPVPKVFAFRTDLDAGQAAGMAVTARTASPFASSPSRVKIGLIAVQLLTALIALGLLVRTRRAAEDPARPRIGWWRTAWVDVGVLAVLAGWTILLGNDQDGSATKRIPVLLTLALLPVVGVLLARRAERADVYGGAAARSAAVVATALVLLWLTPSKWSHHFGALTGLFASFLVVAVVLLVRRARAPGANRVQVGIGVAGGVLVAAASGLAFAGPNAWWQPAAYDAPWAAGPVRPIGLPPGLPTAVARRAGGGRSAGRAAPTRE
jgi:hypothetical protein